MLSINLLKASKENKINVNSLNNFLTTLKPQKASRKILGIHRYFLNNLNKLHKPKQLMSPFSLFNQTPQLINPLKISPANPSALNDKIAEIGQAKNLENPLQNFIKSLSIAAKPQGPLPATSSQFSGQIVGVMKENTEFTTLRIKRPPDWDFQPGQYLEIKAENSGANKPAILAIASGVGDDYIEITGKPNPNSSHANYCLNGNVGDHLKITGPLGTHFPIHLVDEKTPVLILGGGSGLTALKSLMDSLPCGTDAKMIYSSKTAQELLYHDDIEKWKAQGHTISLTQEKVEGFDNGRITDHLVNMPIKPHSLIFLCGPKELVLATAKMLVEKKGVPRDMIFGSLPVKASDGGPVFRGDHPNMMA